MSSEYNKPWQHILDQAEALDDNKPYVLKTDRGFSLRGTGKSLREYIRYMDNVDKDMTNYLLWGTKSPVVNADTSHLETGLFSSISTPAPGQASDGHPENEEQDSKLNLERSDT